MVVMMATVVAFGMIFGISSTDKWIIFPVYTNTLPVQNVNLDQALTNSDTNARVETSNPTNKNNFGKKKKSLPTQKKSNEFTADYSDRGSILGDELSR